MTPERETELRLLRLQIIKAQLEYELDCIKQDNKEIAMYIRDIADLVSSAERLLKGDS
jgi:hypothetical protein